ncbi:kallikrein-15-like [Haliotis rubra]|uniref:kallikrein-15-like n=1 Tax=Haliotis rubra TaxID=36100 RepID=UPI001EE4FF99|nr:kallikrein-15-like [Haliotis rubra]
MRRGGLICTASIIDPTHILTAAHCTEGSAASDLTVGVAEFDITKSDGERVFQVEKVNDHPRYDRTKVINDISILTLTEPIQGVPNAEPICLPRWKQCKDISNRKCVVAGWGAKEIVDNTLVFPNAPRDATVRAYAGSKCPTNRPAPSDLKTQICAVGNSDTCNVSIIYIACRT